MRRKGLALFLMAGILALSGCTEYGSDTEVKDGVTYILSHNGRKAFAAEAEADLNQPAVEITIPSRLSKAKVVGIGGFFGTGVPSPFAITPQNKDTYLETGIPVQSDYCAKIDVREVPVTIHEPEGIDRTLVSEPACYGRRNEYGVLTFVHPVITVLKPDGSEEYRSSLLSEEESSSTLEDRLIGKYFLDYANGESVVYEVFRAFDKIYIHVNSYMEGSEYSFSAMEVIPDDPSLLSSSEADTFDATFRVFSDFAMAGEYTDTVRNRITVRESGLEINALDEKGEVLTAYGPEYERDETKPSQFPNDFSEIPDLVSDGSSMIINSWLFRDRVFDNGHHLIRIYPDGTILIRAKETGRAEVFRGVCAIDYNTKILTFLVHKVGGSRNPVYGKVEVTGFNPNTDISFIHLADWDSWPLLDYDEQEHTFANS